MNPYSVEDLKNSFFADDLQRWCEPKTENIDWSSIEMFAWKHPDDGNFFVCFETKNGLVGTVFQMNAGGGYPANGCGLCGATNRIVGTKPALVASKHQPRRKVGMHVCADLKCSQRVRGEESALFPYETINIERRVQRLQERLERFDQRLDRK